MEPFVADASVGVAWCVPSQASSETDALRSDLGGGRAFFVPGLWLLEVPNTLLLLEKRGVLKSSEITRAQSLIGDLDWILDDEGLHHVLTGVSTLARKLNLTIYDATYLELATRRGLPLATRDERLAKAARKCGVKTLL